MTDQSQAQSPEGEARTRSRSLLALFLVLFSLVGLFLVAKYLVPRALIYLTRAARSGEISLTNSYVFGSPMSASADGQSKIRINVFLLNDQGLGVANKRVELTVKPKSPSVAGNAQIKIVQPTTDSTGRAIFEVTSSFAGQFIVSAIAEGAELPQTVTLTFR